jgi:hypothetical protein
MDEVFIMIAYTVLVCANAILLCVWFRHKRNIKVKIPIFCRYRIYGKFIDSEISIDDIGLAFQELELIIKSKQNNLL